MQKRQENKEKKQAAILAAALTVFSEKGYAAAKIIDIARAADVGKGTIYEYHRSKEDLFFALFQWYVDQMAVASMVHAEDLGGNAEDRLRTLLESLISSFYREIDTFSVFLEFWAAAGNPSMRDRYRSALLSMYDSLRNIIIALVDEGRETGIFRGDLDAFSIAAGLVGAMDGMMLQAWMDREFDVMAASGRFINILIKGMKL
ncbi:TetR/AcrR family transcriptional regulator [Desulfospira joergensenii]|uniref:TetR/AcrR family transcriptional regulator n=1 Tax=Desulfospira joergensenii TaxID=53329 RepID=UPI0003B54550|nr:TetR/AcrR family transcriptional regulator [Desulfospira joergensenii]